MLSKDTMASGAGFVNEGFQPFPSRRSVVHSTEGMVVCAQPLAARCGQKILDLGGNAADAAVAVAAGLNLTEPMSTGVGGDMFCLFYNAKTKTVKSLNGSGRAGRNCTLDKVRGSLRKEDGTLEPFKNANVHSVVVPGAPAGWIDTVERFGSGRLSMTQILGPAIELGEKGFPVSQISSVMWNEEANFWKTSSRNYTELLKKDTLGSDNYRAPQPGELVFNKHLSSVFRALAKDGKKGFYTGPIAEAIIKAVGDRGGYLELEDLEDHMKKGSEITDPISLVYKGQRESGKHAKPVDGSHGQDSSFQDHGVELWEHPPNGQGIVALIALGIFEELERIGSIPRYEKRYHNSPEYIHAVVECLRMAFADAQRFVADPDRAHIPVKELLSRDYLAARAKLFNPDKAKENEYDHGNPIHHQSDTVYCTVTDKEGNAISFINSLFSSAGSGIIPKDTGFTLNSRGLNFNLKEGHPNAYAPGKRPYNTIIPAMITNPHDESLHTTFGVVGGYMQPQGHVQVLLNMVAFGMNPQTALDAPRVCVIVDHLLGNNEDRPKVYLEEGISGDVVDALIAKGHDVSWISGHGRSLFGVGHVIRSHDDGLKVYSAGSDPRGDGAAFPA